MMAKVVMDNSCKFSPALSQPIFYKSSVFMEVVMNMGNNNDNYRSIGLNEFSTKAST